MSMGESQWWTDLHNTDRVFKERKDMNVRDFCYWLQGYFELTDTDNGLTAEQVLIIKDHLNLVFDKQTPDRPQKRQHFDIDPKFLQDPNNMIGDYMIDKTMLDNLDLPQTSC